MADLGLLSDRATWRQGDYFVAKSIYTSEVWTLAMR